MLVNKILQEADFFHPKNISSREESYLKYEIPKILDEISENTEYRVNRYKHDLDQFQITFKKILNFIIEKKYKIKNVNYDSANRYRYNISIILHANSNDEVNEIEEEFKNITNKDVHVSFMDNFKNSTFAIKIVSNIIDNGYPN